MDTKRKEELRKAAKPTLIIIAIVFAYLLLLNGRYADIGGGYCFDKWRCKMIEVEYAD